MYVSYFMHICACEYIYRERETDWQKDRKKIEKKKERRVVENKLLFRLIDVSSQKNQHEPTIYLKTCTDFEVSL